ncbi:maleylpyruvate isomerase family mycothiol-dependent enzyme [Rothia sp. AR01]|uniref:Maleylpyruvate isomerase family mycothiol-dependent enzyme n=1 Tax=Rothia santali TaxID=2949643 RepID=A0A9X2HCS0_9MICC|nr:maleylpyruvate isomerase family mycothiol-dependent enzyme [Rothia santali]MCP3425750.1 maleylpyruvate isomerase family mycothiol-dependent enzyme [Rothia santali]
MTVITDLRENLADVLEAVGPGSPTLCEGWDSQHLLAHLLLRETRPDAAAGIFLPPLKDRTERLLQERAEAMADPEGYARGVAEFREASPLSRRSARVDAAMNFVEYVIHREDARRGSAEATRRAAGVGPFAPDERQRVWDQLRPPLAMFAKDYPDGLELVGTDSEGRPALGSRTIRRPAAQSRVGGLVQRVVRAPSEGTFTVLEGEPVDLLLYLSGRQGAARVSRG